MHLLNEYEHYILLNEKMYNVFAKNLLTLNVFSKLYINFICTLGKPPAVFREPTLPQLDLRPFPPPPFDAIARRPHHHPGSTQHILYRIEYPGSRKG